MVMNQQFNENSSVGEEEEKEESLDHSTFTVLGEVSNKKNEIIVRELPYWLQHPTIVAEGFDDDQGLNISGLDEKIIFLLEKNCIKNFFPVQRSVIPWLLDANKKDLCWRPRDICVSAPTGSGKTLAYVLPIIQGLKNSVASRVRAVVVLPVQDLAFQVFKVFQIYCKAFHLKPILLIGQKSFSQEQSELVAEGVRGYLSLADIVVATPGKLVDHINRTPGFCLEYLRYLVIDEADRMMDEIEQGWLLEVEKAIFKSGSKGVRHVCLCPSGIHSCRHISLPLQKLLFSATLSQDPEKLQKLSLFHPKLFSCLVKADGHHISSRSDASDSMEVDSKGHFIGKYTTPLGLKEYFCVCEQPSIKPLMLWHLVKRENFKRVLCFVSSITNAHRLYLLLKEMGGISVCEFSSSIKGIKKKIILKKFASGKIDIIVCSDALARGMDIANVDCVICYERPLYVNTYVHRIGRTARAGKEGVAITLLEKMEVKKFQSMVKYAGKKAVRQMKISLNQIQEYKEQYQTALKNVSKTVTEEKHRQQNLKNPVMRLKMKKKKLQNNSNDIL